jgi:predicted ATPase
VKARIEEIRLQNFRAIENARLTLSDLTFLVGRNGAGKSSILDAVEFMREAMTEGLNIALARRGGLLTLHRRGAGDEPTAVAVVMRAELLGRTVRMLYGFRLSPKDLGRNIEEVLRVNPTKDMGFDRTGDQCVSGTRGSITVPMASLALPLLAAEQLWEIALDTLSQMRAYEIAPSAVARAVQPRSPTNLERTGENAGDVLEEIALRPEAHRRILGALTAIAPEIVDVTGDIERSSRVVNFVQRFGEQLNTFGANEMSQGTLRALGILLAIYQNPEPSLLLIDEIEDSVHPLAVDALLLAIEHALDRFPIVVTTHSPEVLSRKQATGDRLRVLQWNDGVTRLYRLGRGTLNQLDDITTVGWLLSINGIGVAEPPETWDGDILELR